jgi:hypothetical protein
MIQKIILLSLFFCGNMFSWLEFTNTLQEEINITLYFENNTFKSFVLAPKMRGQIIYASDDESSHNELPVRQIVAWSNKRVIIDWNGYALGEENQNLLNNGTPMYGYKDTGLLNLNKNLRSTRFFKSNLPDLKEYNGMILDCRSSAKGFDTSKNPLEIIIIEQLNFHERSAILQLLPPYYMHVIPAGAEIGGTRLVVLAKKIKQ